MRVTLVVVFVWTMVSAGCSMFIAHCGKKLEDLKTREQAFVELGPPVESCNVEGAHYDVFRYHGKVSRGHESSLDKLAGIVVTLGLSDLVMIPVELARGSWDLLLGAEVKLWYTEAGTISRGQLNGMDLPGQLFIRTVQVIEVPVMTEVSMPTDR